MEGGQRDILVWGLRHPRLSVVASLLLTVSCGLGILQLTITADYRVFFSADNPQLKAFNEQEALFYKTDTVIFALGGDIYSPRGMAALGWLTAQARTLPYAERVVSLSNYPYSYSQGNTLFMDDLVPQPTAVDAQALALIRQRAEDDPEVRGRLVSAAGDSAMIIASVQLPGLDQQSEIPAVTLPARELVAEFQQRWPQFEIHLLGLVPFNQALSEATFHDLWVLFPVSIALMMAVLWWLLRGFVPMLITGCVILASVAVAMGLAGWWGVVLTTATAVAPVIIMTLAIAHSVHLFTNYQQALADGNNASRALQHSLRLNLRPVTLTSLTTVIGFLAMNFSDAPPFRELGNIVALGVVASWGFALILLPALVLLLRSGLAAQRPVRDLDGLGRWVTRHYRRLIPAMLLLCLPLLSLLPLNSVNDVFREWFEPHNPVRAGMEFAMQRMDGVETIYYTLDSGVSGGISEPAFTGEVEAFAQWLQAQPEVAHVSDFRAVLKRMNRVLQGDTADQYRLPTDAALARQYLTIYELALPAGHSLNNLLDLDKRRARMTVTVKRIDSVQVRNLDVRARDWLAAHAPHVQAQPASGALMMFAELGQRNIRGMLLGTVLALVGISLLLVLALGSLRIGLISLIPNLLPAALGFGLWGLISAEVNLAISVVMGMTLGIVVDDTIHFLSKYMVARRELGLDPAAAVQEAFRKVGRALWVTTVVLVGGFLVLALSEFRPTADMGLLTALVLVLALIADFFLLPPLLIALEGRAKPTRSSA